MMKDYDEWRFLCALIRLVYPEERRTHYKKKLREKYFGNCTMFQTCQNPGCLPEKSHKISTYYLLD